ncbi:Arylsulfatase A [Lutibacter oricola]|uniref:Arylsulfatase A n=1 Tax=Lutibacter oricola TaxID=762486 RepID=A0A1H2SE12_9FLAO|nr:sulfatase-like hydrolase/transferase [Lutibacter oricola]SDW29738.1 Arylsulfatase A [Lutibacter oricola]
MRIKYRMKKQYFNKLCLVVFTVFVAGNFNSINAQSKKPNFILIMADDLGYGDTGFNGNKIIKTPNLDALAGEGMLLTHFYSGNSVCSPTRATLLTGRHHDRMGIYTANKGHLPKQEITIAKLLKSKGYTTGHFGKWHLGTLSKTVSSKGASRKPALNFAPPWLRDYDVSFVTESAVTTWNPGIGVRAKNNPFYENGEALKGEGNVSLMGGAARVVVDRVIPFIEKAVDDNNPFLSVIWFHAPHKDIEAGPKYLKMYKEHKEAAHFYGCITELDEQVGRIVETLKKTGQLNNSIIFFCSDNGPEGRKPSGRVAGTTNGLRGRKRSLYDGGVRVPAFAVWPGVIKKGTTSNAVLSTLDYLPTIKNIVNYKMPDNRPIDGQDILPILKGETNERTKSIVFRYGAGTTSIVKGNLKYLLPSKELYNISKDYSEENNLVFQMPKKALQLEKELLDTFKSIEKSHSGLDYNDSSFKPVEKWEPVILDLNWINSRGGKLKNKSNKNKTNKN